ncbi:hypothetical protein L2E82_30074 [Cichorium intybus]|uniref:Uncharacterized protein n=1 Tax=Cichorium intybus TaxID=13427 RepID=A0ACB9CZP7_CICIN|nr:hypothetical protein L2E82_30074 [Cichorium intybus]
MDNVMVSDKETPQPIDCSSIDDGSPSLDLPLSKPVENAPITPALVRSIEPSRSNSTTHVTIPPILSTLSPSTMSVGSPSSLIGELSILGL